VSSQLLVSLTRQPIVGRLPEMVLGVEISNNKKGKRYYSCRARDCESEQAAAARATRGAHLRSRSTPIFPLRSYRPIAYLVCGFLNLSESVYVRVQTAGGRVRVRGMAGQMGWPLLGCVSWLPLVSAIRGTYYQENDAGRRASGRGGSPAGSAGDVDVEWTPAGSVVVGGRRPLSSRSRFYLAPARPSLWLGRAASSGPVAS
jgi:hypothetical protein